MLLYIVAFMAGEQLENTEEKTVPVLYRLLGHQVHMSL
jgi:hypothetical protein